MLNVAVLFGGRSGEHEVSLISAASIVRNLDAQRYRVLLIGIDKTGRWHLQPEALLRSVRNEGASLSIDTAEHGTPEHRTAEHGTAEQPSRLVLIQPGAGLRLAGTEETLPVDVVFPVLHGTFGEDGTIQGALEIAGLPYVGAGVPGSAIGMDKEIAKRVWQAAGLPVTPYMVLRRSDFDTLEDRALVDCRRVATERFGFPLFVKPARAGSSVGISCVESGDELFNAVRTAFRFDNKLLLEPAVPGQEIECSVVGNSVPTAYPPGEVIPSHRFYDYDAKYVDPDGARLEIPALLTAAESAEVQRIAAEAHRAVGADGMSRVDFLVHNTKRTIYINEINTIPGFTSISMFPRMCEAAGLAYPRLLDTLIELALNRYREEQELSFDYAALDD